MPRASRSNLRVSRTFSFPSDRVLDAWLDPKVARRWLFATPGGRVVRCEIEARPGGRFTITDRRGGEDVEHVGTYLEIDRPRRLRFEFAVPKYSSERSVVTVTVARADAGCRVTLMNASVPAEWVEQSRQGWRDLLERLQAVLAGARPARPAPAVGAAFTFRPLTPERWPDLVALFGPRGACAGCWCMFWRLPRREWEAARGAGTKRRLAAIVRSGRPTGVIAYDGGEPVGWCAAAPRKDYRGLSSSKILAPVDDTPVWSITCFFVQRGYRRRGLTTGLIGAAAEYARSKGATTVEGYPKDTNKPSADAFLWNGLVAPFARAGFEEVARRSATRPIMRKTWR